MKSIRLLAFAAVPLLTLNLLAADPALKPLMTKPGKLLFSDDLSDAALSKEWRAAKGKWEGAGGAMQAAELKADMHGAVARHTMPFHDVIIQYSFKLQGARATTLSINDAKEHVCRVLINKAGFTVQKDDHDHAGPDKAALLDRQEAALDEGKWHTVLVEIRGKEMLAQLGGRIGYGAHEAIDVDKANFGFTVAGESVQFKDVQVWEALSNPDWAGNRKELEARPKLAAVQPKAKAKQK
ncbi:MAG: hypothetical protein AB1705_18900 [Verrucomicrobiota bacterium]